MKKEFISALLFLPLAVPCYSLEQERETVMKHVLEAGAPLAYLEADEEGGWSAMKIGNMPQLSQVAGKLGSSRTLLIPVFPTVPNPGPHSIPDAGYYDYILKNSGIKRGDKILVVGPGSGSDCWAAWLKSGTTVYAVDINPLAVANTMATAGLAGFPVKVIESDINDKNRPPDFSGFDYVLWNMPFFAPGTKEEPPFRDFEDGSALDGFIRTLPSLLRPGGTAVLLNTPAAAERIKWRNKEVLKLEDGGPYNAVLIVLKSSFTP